MRLSPSPRRVRKPSTKPRGKTNPTLDRSQEASRVETPEWTLDVRRYYRAVLANWPDEWRERWGLRANELQDTGLAWREAEVQAFIEIWNNRRVGKNLNAV